MGTQFPATQSVKPDSTQTIVQVFRKKKNLGCIVNDIIVGTQGSASDSIDSVLGRDTGAVMMEAGQVVEKRTSGRDTMMKHAKEVEKEQNVRLFSQSPLFPSTPQGVWTGKDSTPGVVKQLMNMT